MLAIRRKLPPVSEWRHHWQGENVIVALNLRGTRLPLDRWAEHRPSAARVAEWLGMSPASTEIHLTAKSLASLSDYDASQLGLPLHMDAWVHLSTEGRIDSPKFQVSLALEPMQFSHPWVAYRRNGAIVTVGERIYRLHPGQLEVMELYEALLVAGDDIAKRLVLLPRLVEAQHMTRQDRVRVSGAFSRPTLHRMDDAGGKVLLTRKDGRVVPFESAPETGWAMSARQHYYL